MRKIAWLLLLTLLSAILVFPITAEPISNSGVLEHWKFQNSRPRGIDPPPVLRIHFGNPYK
ncbi:MAG: hypothetical protein IJZ80_03355 [Clostridia bacterium]|nr:hypothetical protein [Clostridia bacterium]